VRYDRETKQDGIKTIVSAASRCLKPREASVELKTADDCPYIKRFYI